MAQHNILGKKGEDEVCNYLKQKGYLLVHRNWRCEGYETDIIARDGDFLVFVEVKTRRSSDWGHPADAVSAGRMRRMIAAADAYLSLSDEDVQVRFDIVAVLWDGRSFRIEHIEDAFLAF